MQKKLKGYKEGTPIPCPVCGSPMCFAKGDFSGNATMGFKCNGKCGGKIRFVTSEYIENCLTREEKASKVG